MVVPIEESELDSYKPILHHTLIDKNVIIILESYTNIVCHVNKLSY